MTTVDPIRHADDAAKSFSKVRTKYELLAEQVHRIIKQSFDALAEVNIHKIEYRAKDVESFRGKCGKINKEGNLKYPIPLDEITDLSGVRIILFFPDDIKKICEFVENHFDCVENLNIGEERFLQSGILGYQSIHYLVKIQKDRLKLPDFSKFAEMVCEIQIRTILQHAWAEMEHDIQYKSLQSLPSEIRRKFTALAGMLEIADREFQSIQSDHLKLRQSVRKSLEEQLTKEGISAPMPESLVVADSSSQDHSSSPARNARDLVITGDFAKAIEVYSEQILKMPTAHTLYLGRAKAKFLAGDREGALNDINLAKSYNADDPAIKIAQTQIEEGTLKKPSSNSDKAHLYLKMGNEHLSKGDGESAFEYFSIAQDEGYNYIFSIFNKAMACCLVRDTTGAQIFLSELRPVNGSPMMLNYISLKTIIYAMDSKSINIEAAELKERRGVMKNFSYAISPLRNLEAGFMARDGALPRFMPEVIDILRGPQEDNATHPSSTPQ